MTTDSAVISRPTKRWLTVDQLLDIVPIKRSRLYYLTHTHQIPGVCRIGRTLLFDYDAVTGWLEAHREG
jgi:excisionase family DNA binding protein